MMIKLENSTSFEQIYTPFSFKLNTKAREEGVLVTKYSRLPLFKQDFGYCSPERLVSIADFSPSGLAPGTI